MNTRLSTWCSSAAWRRLFLLLLAAALVCPLGSPAQQKDKKKKNVPMTDNSSGNPVVPMTDQQQIDYMISEMLGAWQIGDVERMHKDYDENVSVVSGIWSPPLIGWNSYLASYQQQRARMKEVRLDRSNTFIKVAGNFAWACYQWDFGGMVDGRPAAAKGQTTLIMEKKDNRWLIVHNHTSLIENSSAPPASQSTQLAQPSAAQKP
jgi:ketosteroid isomerase-like protein